ncbi:hypothetical protein CPHLJ_8g3045 [Cryptosporidium parvum]|nr:hypothetical protein CPCDC_8g3045 [Cryptosporidium sp. 43IA8]
MAAAVGYYELVKIEMSFFSESVLVSFFTILISNLLFEKIDEVIRQCSREIMKFFVGFIYESFQNNGEINSILIESIHSKRILLSSHVSTISEVS